MRKQRDATGKSEGGQYDKHASVKQAGDSDLNLIGI
jgi:hypothetical protein